MQHADFDLVATWLARRDGDTAPDRPAPGTGPTDVVVLCGTSVLDVAALAAAAMLAGAGRHLLVCGGVGHATSHLYRSIATDRRTAGIDTGARPEAHILSEFMCDRLGLDRSLVVVEDRSTNCGNNATLGLAALQAAGVPHRRITVLQDPLMQRRSHASFVRAWRDVDGAEVASWAAFVPRFPLDADRVWGHDRFVSLLLGEIPRLHDTASGYGPAGLDFIDHVDVPDEVLAAHHRLAAAYPGLSDQRGTPV